jgi:hypothetical protein
MKRMIAGLVAATTIAASATLVSAPAEARCVGCAVGAGVAAGLIGGALIAGAAQASPGYYPPAYVAGPRPGCYYTRDRVWDAAYGVWRRGPRVLVCP